jgi:hypothetical protein
MPLLCAIFFVLCLMMLSVMQDCNIDCVVVNNELEKNVSSQHLPAVTEESVKCSCQDSLFVLIII